MARDAQAHFQILARATTFDLPPLSILPRSSDSSTTTDNRSLRLLDLSISTKDPSVPTNQVKNKPLNVKMVRNPPFSKDRLRHYLVQPNVHTTHPQ